MTQSKEQAVQQPTQVAVSSNAVALKRFQEETANNVLDRVNAMQETGELVLPQNYHAGNAVRLAWLYLQTVKDKNDRPAVDVCTKESICNCFLEMIIKGLSVAKKQCYFIVTGNQLSFWEDYRGKFMRAKRDTEIATVNAQVVYEGDEFVYTVDENGLYQLVKHTTKMENINIDKITGAYGVVINKDGSKHLEIMTMAMIRNSWQQGAARGNSGAHNKFTDQMCKKTVISRACKVALGSAEDEDFAPDAAARERTLANASSTKNIEPTVEPTEYVELPSGENVNPDTGEIAQPQDMQAVESIEAEAQPAKKCPL
jgi:recombination protein RecT